jgi:hypothetical protein
MSKEELHQDQHKVTMGRLILLPAQCLAISKPRINTPLKLQTHSLLSIQCIKLQAHSLLTIKFLKFQAKYLFLVKCLSKVLPIPQDSLRS